MKDVDKCFDNVEKTSNNPKSSELIKTSKGLDQICSNSLDVVKCLKGYMKKCGTPIQRELFDFGTEHFTKSTEQFCAANGAARRTFLQHSPCIHDKVISQNTYRENCVNPMLATLDKTKELEVLDDRLDASCCAFTRWTECTNDLINKNCGAEAVNAMKSFVSDAIGGLSNMVCTKKAFDPNKSRCKKLYADKSAKAKGKLSDNPVTKYVASYFGFLF
ncbi:hypothetical protein B4U79_00961 [Dinothrombium tinctorium]|uniref:DUF19 domain-containing protein n=2 Tax=Dinothrombium tinctorium TaxID=1965070 RepID=A0A3S3Q269_9ACAR|nr:hypothetical protein B4U79_00961 [Dinothrombium tinctorium]